MESIRLSEREAQELLPILRDLHTRNMLPNTLAALLNTLETVALFSGSRFPVLSGPAPLATPPQTPSSNGVFVPPDTPPISGLNSTFSSNSDSVFTFTAPSSLSVSSTTNSPAITNKSPAADVNSNALALDQSDPNNSNEISSRDKNAASSTVIPTGKKTRRRTRKGGKGRYKVMVGAGGDEPPDGDEDPLVAHVWLPECDRGGVAVPAGGVQVVHHALSSWQDSSTVANTMTVPAATIISAMGLAAGNDLSNANTGPVAWISAIQSLVKGESWAESSNAFLDNSVSSIVSRCQRAVNMNIGLEFVLMINFIQLAAKVDR